MFVLRLEPIRSNKIESIIMDAINLACKYESDFDGIVFQLNGIDVYVDSNTDSDDIISHYLYASKLLDKGE